MWKLDNSLLVQVFRRYRYHVLPKLPFVSTLPAAIDFGDLPYSDQACEFADVSYAIDSWMET